MSKMPALIFGLLIMGMPFRGPALGQEPPPAIQELGPVVPTPVPSPEKEDRLRLISSFTVQNRPNGDSVIAFEATEYVRSKDGEYRTVAAEIYSLAASKEKAGDLRLQILEKIRDLEWDLLEYVEQVGPPREREPLGSNTGGAERPR